ncbi:hypothetical protein V6N11_034219 [Hibiscus sabdariffa]|uniref:Uncharacterized protein n=1 Tax=Hibiscus sabdariffa TaxID=183260 RepID=A0ABR2NEM8_9ROSI
MLSQGNLYGSSLTLRQLDNFGGRPPDGILVISPLQSLKRPSSPTQLEGESVMKKVRSSVDVVFDSGRVAMDADHGTEMDSDARDVDVAVPLCLRSRVNKVSASINSIVQHSGSWFGVLASENLEAVREASIVGDGTTVASERTETQQTRVEQLHNVSRVEGNVVALEPTRGATTCSEAYLASNPDKKKKKVSSKHLGSVEVIPIVDGTDSTTVNHMPVVSSGSHAAVRIIEKTNDSVIPHHKDVTDHQADLDRVGGVMRKGLRIGKPMNSGKGGLRMIEWVKSTHARIDSIGKQPNKDSSSNSTAMDESHNDYTPSDDEEIWEEDQLAHMSDMDDAVDMGGTPRSW